MSAILVFLLYALRSAFDGGRREGGTWMCYVPKSRVGITSVPVPKTVTESTCLTSLRLCPRFLLFAFAGLWQLFSECYMHTTGGIRV